MEFEKHFDQCALYSAEQSSREKIKNEPALYAFFEQLHFEPNKMQDQIDTFKAKHARVLSLAKSTSQRSFLPDHVRIKLRGNPERFKGEGLRILTGLGHEQKSDASSLLRFLSFLNEPLYIGKAKNMRVRFLAHHDKDFLFKMKKDYQRAPEQFVLFVFYCDYDLVRLLESVLLQIVNPPFCVQTT